MSLPSFEFSSLDLQTSKRSLDLGPERALQYYEDNS